MPYRILLRELAEQRNMSQAEVARKATLSLDTVRGIWNDPGRVVRTTTLEKLARALEVDTQDLIRSIK